MALELHKDLWRNVNIRKLSHRMLLYRMCRGCCISWSPGPWRPWAGWQSEGRILPPWSRRHSPTLQAGRPRGTLLGNLEHRADYLTRKGIVKWSIYKNLSYPAPEKNIKHTLITYTFIHSNWFSHFSSTNKWNTDQSFWMFD